MYVGREDRDSRQKTIQDIINRTTSQNDWPQVKTRICTLIRKGESIEMESHKEGIKKFFNYSMVEIYCILLIVIRI